MCYFAPIMIQNFDIKKVKQGNPDVFKQFFEFHYPRMMGLARRFVDDETARDMVHDVFVDYWEQKENVEVANISSYLFKSVQNKCLNHIKHQAVIDGYAANVKIAQSRMDYLARTTDDNELFRQISDRDIREHIEASVGKLPPKCQEAFRLCYFDEMTCREAAEVMGLSPRTVEGHVQKAVAQLREDLRPLMIWLVFAKFFLH